jgi:hypothetical protein
VAYENVLKKRRKPKSALRCGVCLRSDASGCFRTNTTCYSSKLSGKEIMPQLRTNIRAVETKPSRFELNAIIYGPIRPSRELDRMTQRALKEARGDKEFFTEITLRDTRKPGLMGVDFSVTSSSPASAQIAGIVYLGQLCDVLSSITRQPVRFLMPGEDSREERVRADRVSTHIDRILTHQEWNWVIATLVSLRQSHSIYLAASSWYRKGLCGIDPLEVTCCYWRVIERLAKSYYSKSKLPTDGDGKPICTAKNQVRQFVAEQCLTEVSGGLLADEDWLKKIVNLRNNVSHGNEPITPELIEDASKLIIPLEEAAYSCLSAIRDKIDRPEI